MEMHNLMKKGWGKNIFGGISNYHLVLLYFSIIVVPFRRLLDNKNNSILLLLRLVVFLLSKSVRHCHTPKPAFCGKAISHQYILNWRVPLLHETRNFYH